MYFHDLNEIAGEAVAHSTVAGRPVDQRDHDRSSRFAACRGEQQRGQHAFAAP